MERGGIPSPHSAAAAVLDIHARPYVRPTVPLFFTSPSPSAAGQE